MLPFQQNQIVNSHNAQRSILLRQSAYRSQDYNSDTLLLERTATELHLAGSMKCQAYEAIRIRYRHRPLPRATGIRSAHSECQITVQLHLQV